MKNIIDEFADSSELDNIVDNFASDKSFKNIVVNQAYEDGEMLYVEAEIEDILFLNDFKDYPEAWGRFRDKEILPEDLEMEAEIAQEEITVEYKTEMLSVLKYELADYIRSGFNRWCENKYEYDPEDNTKVEVEFEINSDSFSPKHLITIRKQIK